METSCIGENGYFSLLLLILLLWGLLDEDLEIELVEEEPPFLRGHTKQSMDMSPIKIVKVRNAGPITWMGQVCFFSESNCLVCQSRLLRPYEQTQARRCIDCWLESRVFLF